MKRTGFGVVQKPRIKSVFGATTVHKRIKNKARNIGFGFRKG